MNSPFVGNAGAGVTRSVNTAVGAGSLPKLLHRAVLGGDVNECCGVLRRVFSESPESESRLFRSRIQEVISLGHGCVKADVHLVKQASLSILSHASHQVGDWQSAVFFSQFLELKPSPGFLSSLLRPGNVDSIMKVCAERRWELDVTNAIRVLAQERGSWSSALRVARWAEQELNTVERFSSAVLIPHLAASGHWDAAARIFLEGLAEGRLTDPAMLANLVRATASLQQWRTCLFMLRALDRTKEAESILPNSPELFGRVVDICPDWKSAVEMFNLARAVGVKPDKRMVSSVLAVCETHGAWAAATAVYDTAVAEDFVSSLDGVSCGSLVRSLHASRQWEKALAALSWMARASESAAATGRAELLELCEQSGEWEAALNIGATLTEEPHLLPASTSVAVLLACAKGSQWEFAMEFYTSMLHDVRQTPSPLAACAVLQACVAARQWEPALKFYSGIRLAQPRVVIPPLAHQLVLRACASANRWNESLQLLSVMRDDGLPQDNYNQRLGLWASAAVGSWTESLEYYQRIPTTVRTQNDLQTVRKALRPPNSSSSSSSSSFPVNTVALRYLQRLQQNNGKLNNTTKNDNKKRR